MLDSVSLPYADSVLGDGSSDAEETRWMAFARASVMKEIKSDAGSKQAWSDAIEESDAAQRRHDEAHRAFLLEVQQRLHGGVDDGIPSPLTGAVRPVASRGRCGLLDLVEVAAPPLRLRSTGANVAASQAQPYAIVAKGDGAEEEQEQEAPLLASSSLTLTPAASPTPVSQAALDAVFFESLVSQELNLALWRSVAVPQEALRCALEEVQQLDRALCVEDATVRYINTVRFTEQRTYKRRRSELKAQLCKTHEKVTALERLLGTVATEPPTATSCTGERLRASMCE
ncbi:hypothetical protein NESM_000015200 [Novymonas esmeraldas]|uniref:Uncharacterized protein n=1 Tax=Novymonas esmeraldas TaxID=1808958 RepID=A0AAW0F0P9_9TRYP